MNKLVFDRRASSFVAALVLCLGSACSDDTTNPGGGGSDGNPGGGGGSDTGGTANTTGGNGTGATGGTATGGMGTGGAGGTVTTTTGGAGGVANGGNGGSGGAECAAPGDCPQGANECQAAICTNGTCGIMNVQDGTEIQPIDFDCQRTQCDGNGAVELVDDDADLPDDGNECTDDVCDTGVASNPPFPPGDPCGSMEVCDGNGNCVGCVVADTCPGVDDECQTRTCTQGMCGFDFTPAGPIAAQTPGDCVEQQCDGNGTLVAVNLDTDVFDDANDCTSNNCVNGMPANPPVAAGSVCTQNGGQVCSGAGQCTRTFSLVRVGDGSAALSLAATPVFIEERYVSDGTLAAKASANPLPLPTAATLAQARLTLSGTSNAEGALSLSSDGKVLALAGYDSAPGTASVNTTPSVTTNRIVGRVDAFGNVDTSTRITSLFTGSQVRTATTDNGSRFWVGGAVNGAVFINQGGLGGTSILAAPANNRVFNVFGGQLYGSSGSMTFVNVFTIGVGLPTTAGQTATSLPGLPTQSASPFGFVMFDLNPNIAGVDTVYITDDGASPNGGLIRYDFDGTTWTLKYKLNQVDVGGAIGFMNFRGVTGYAVGTTVTLVGSQPNNVAVFVDTGNAAPVGKLVLVPSTNTAFRGVAMSPR